MLTNKYKEEFSMNQTVKLNNGVEMPTLGYGVFQIPEDETKEVVAAALKTGYRLIDTAAGYRNERAVGAAIRESGIPREEIFLTTKLWVQDFGEEKATKAIDEALERLNIGYIDLLLLHQPMGDIYGAWRAMEQAVADGKVRSIGVSNFESFQVQDLMMHNKIKPVVNQIQINPFNPENQNVQWLLENDILPEAWGPMGQARDGVFENPVLVEIAQNHQKSVGQIMLAWNLQRGVIVIPKSVHIERIQENFALADITLTDTEMNQITTLDSNSSYFEGLLTPDTVKVLGEMTFDL